MIDCNPVITFSGKSLDSGSIGIHAVGHDTMCVTERNRAIWIS